MYWCFSGILPFLLVQGPALGSSSSSGCWIKSTNLADRMYWRTRLKERSFTFCKTNKTPHLSIHLHGWKDKHTERNTMTERYSQDILWGPWSWSTGQGNAGDTWTLSPLECRTCSSWKSRKCWEKFLQEGQKGREWGWQTMNSPVYIEAFEHQKNGVLLLSWNHSCAVRLHADESMTDESLPHVVQLSSVDPDETQYLQLHSERRHGAATTPPLHDCTSRLLERASVQISL